MPIYDYKAMNSSGQELTGIVEAATNEAAIGMIRMKGHFPTAVKERKVTAGDEGKPVPDHMVMRMEIAEEYVKTAVANFMAHAQTAANTKLLSPLHQQRVNDITKVASQVSIQLSNALASVRAAYAMSEKD